MNHHDIMEAANGARLTIGGIPVRVSGAGNPRATVRVSDRKHPLYLFQAEYAWESIERAINGKGKLS